MEQNNIQEMAVKVLKQIRNKIYLNNKALSPAIYRMPIQFVEPGTGVFGTDANQIYADPIMILKCYKKSTNEFARMYLHMLFHCIYLHPFITKYNIDKGMWNIALDICAEAAVSRLDSFAIDGDTERLSVINQIKQKVKMFIPELVYNELIKGTYDIIFLIKLFHMDDHLWLETSQSNNNSKDSDNNEEDNDYQNPNQKPQNDGSNNQKDDDMSENQHQGDNSASGNQDSSDNSDSNNQNKNNNSDSRKNNRPKSKSANSSAQKKQEWSDVSRQIAADMQSFHQQGNDSGDTVQEIDYLTQDKMDYEEFLRQFSIIEEKMMVNQDEFDYMYYTYGLNGIKSPNGKDSTGKKVLLIEPLEYKEEKVIKDFVIAIDTSGSCSGTLVNKFLNKTYSILKESESFSSRVNIHIIQCDATIQKDTKITNMDEMEYFMKNMKLYGFGGTDFRPVFQYVDKLIKEKEFDNLCGLIYFTDGYGTYPKTPTQYKTAFAFLEDYSNRDDVPSWAMSVYWKDED